MKLLPMHLFVTLWSNLFLTHRFACAHLLPYCHELAFFTFFLLLFYCIDTCCYSPKSHFKHKLTLLVIHFAFLLCFRPSRKSKSACIQSHKVANTTQTKLQRTARFEDRQKQRLSNCPEERQDQRPPLGSASRHDRSSANLPRHHLPRCPPERSTPTCRAKDRWTRQ